MWTEEKVQKTAISLNFKPFLTKKSLKSIYKVLKPDEEILSILEGELQEIHGKKSLGSGLLVLTQKRIIFYKKNFIGITTQEDYPLKRISSISHKSGVMNASLVIYAANNEAVVKNVIPKKQVSTFIDMYNDIVLD